MPPKPHHLPGKPERCSSILLMRRAWWANSKGYPRWHGWTIDPHYVKDPDYQAQVTAWYATLDDKAKSFLGRDYARFATPRKKPE